MTFDEQRKSLPDRSAGFCDSLKKRYYSKRRYSRMSPGWQSNASHSLTRVDIFSAFALPFFSTETLARVMPTRYDSSVTLIFRLASITSILKMI